METETMDTTKKDTGFKTLVDKIIIELTGGIKHGFFHSEIDVHTMHSGRREVIFTAGKSHKFHIPLEDANKL